MVFHLTYGKYEEELRRLAELKASEGCCISIDISGSTQLKRNTRVKEWAIKMTNVFQLIRGFGTSEWQFIKAIGDELMIFVPVHEAMALRTFESLVNVVRTTKESTSDDEKAFFRSTKAAVCYCTDAYNINLFDDSNDYMGLDIDKTFRIAKQANEGEIVMDEEFYKRLKQDEATYGSAVSHQEVDNISVPIAVQVKDFGTVNLYKWPSSISVPHVGT
jgi:hypothetical protein